MEPTTKSTMGVKKISLAILGIAILVALIIIVPKSQQAVASVNGKSIPKRQFDQKVEQTLSIVKTVSGGTAEITEEQRKSIEGDVLNSLIAEELINEYAKENNITVSAKEVEDEYMVIATANGGEEQLTTQLKQFGVSKTTFTADIKKDLLLKKSVEHSTEPSLLTVSEEEIKASYDALVKEAEKSESKEPVPAYDEVKDSLTTQLKNQKIMVHSQTLIEELKGKAEIKVLI